MMPFGKVLSRLEQDNTVKRFADILWNALNWLRGAVDMSDAFMLVLYFLYCNHKNYAAVFDGAKEGKIRFTDKMQKDPIFRELYKYIDIWRVHDRSFKMLCEAGMQIRDIDLSDKEVYILLLESLLDRFSSTGGKSTGEIYTPRELTEVMAYLVNQAGCKSIYDPFCGSAAVVNHIEGDDIQFSGQDIFERTALIARLVCEARLGKKGCITVADSLRDWNPGTFDAVVSCPPFNLKFQPFTNSALYDACPPFKLGPECYEDLLFRVPLHYNNANLVVNLMPHGFCFRGAISLHSLRKHLVEENFLDTIVSLPAGILYSTSMPTVLVVCRKGRKSDEPVKFIDATEFVEGDRRNRRLMAEDLIGVLKSGNPRFVHLATREQIAEHDFNLNPALYSDEVFELGEGQKVVKLSHLISESVLPSTDFDGSMEFVTPAVMGTEIIPLLLGADRTIDRPRNDNALSRRFKYIPEGSGKKYLLEYFMRDRTSYSLHLSESPAILFTGVRAYEINENVVTPEYLAYILTRDEAAKGCPLASLQNKSLIIDSLPEQREIIAKITQEYNEKVRRETEADAARLGIKHNVSDLEHMLGSTQLRIARIISRLENIRPDDSKYIDTIKALKDNTEYLNRVIKYESAQINASSFRRIEGDLQEFISEYAKGWANYGGNYFKLSIDTAAQSYPAMLDKGMLTVMLDSILGNAARHGFHKNKEYTQDNQVIVYLSQVEYQDKGYNRMSICNNGDPIRDDFTIKDYISRGRYTANSGRSGLGGHHVYQIVKGHDGFMALDSNKTWNVVVDILIPMSTEVEPSTLEIYEQECI